MGLALGVALLPHDGLCPRGRTCRLVELLHLDLNLGDRHQCGSLRLHVARLLKVVPHVIADLQRHLPVLLLEVRLCEGEEGISRLLVVAGLLDERQGILPRLEGLVELPEVEVQRRDAAGDLRLHGFVIEILEERQGLLRRREGDVVLLHLAIGAHQQVQGLRLGLLLACLLVALHALAGDLRRLGDIATLDLCGKDRRHRLDLLGGLQQLVNLQGILTVLQGLLHILGLEVPLGHGEQLEGLCILVL
mmetsp:Transcript_6615/g.21319  ORF Transcript_6615/g.21319 Transcript_6615/m.21319 type:complete len:248 (+) Transcript_6615:1115-1858(+)